jgi:hypothetical protein
MDMDMHKEHHQGLDKTDYHKTLCQKLVQVRLAQRQACRHMWQMNLAGSQQQEHIQVH